MRPPPGDETAAAAWDASWAWSSRRPLTTYRAGTLRYSLLAEFFDGLPGRSAGPAGCGSRKRGQDSGHGNAQIAERHSDYRGRRIEYAGEHLDQHHRQSPRDQRSADQPASRDNCGLRENKTADLAAATSEDGEDGQAAPSLGESGSEH